MLEVQEEQSNYLKTISTVAQLIGVLIVLSMIASCLLMFLGGRSLF